MHPTTETYALSAPPSAFADMARELRALHTQRRQGHIWYGRLLWTAGLSLCAFALYHAIGSGDPAVTGGWGLLLWLGCSLTTVQLFRAMAAHPGSAGGRRKLPLAAWLWLFGFASIALWGMLLWAEAGGSLALFDLRIAPWRALSALTVASCGYFAGLSLSGWLVDHGHGALNPDALTYCEQLLQPLTADAALGARASVQVGVLEPRASDWISSREGDDHHRSYERELLRLSLPLEAGEQLTLAIDERYTTTQRVRRNARGKIKTKPRGAVREVVATLRWQLRTAVPSPRDLSQALTAHLTARGERLWGVRLAADGDGQRLQIRVRVRDRFGAHTPSLPAQSWLAPAILLHCTQFLAAQRANLPLR